MAENQAIQPTKKKKKYAKKSYLETGRLTSSVNLSRLTEIEASLKKTLNAVCNEVDRLDVEWLQLCNIAVAPKIEPTVLDLHLRTSDLNNKSFDNVDVINSVAIDLQLNINKNSNLNERVEDYESDEDT
ncbi:uncharacterized protein LOC108744918 [Agrilus planipennis]|uniref:Uncharacterized protein LOC108744918 n=1 Tax=Agrilus planipennis TaxID=224129 RepID=A0A1W4XV89_AGRPL|nr:uncharacterized protein LOC108744918 [Agrilus planipennis]